MAWCRDFDLVRSSYFSFVLAPPDHKKGPTWPTLKYPSEMFELMNKRTRSGERHGWDGWEFATYVSFVVHMRILWL